MTTAAIQDRVDELFADARNVHAQAIERLQNGDIRDAAEKAWCATKRATDALILARTGEEPPTTAAHHRSPRQPLPSRPRKFKRSKVATTAESTTCTVCASIPAIATSRPSAASTKPPRISTTPRPSPLDEWQILNCQPSCGRGPSPQRGSGHFSTKADK